MKPNLAEELLVKLMDWTEERVASERPLLQAMASFKFDEYQQFGPGMRYTESLVNWLYQFETLDEKEFAYNYIKTNLVFISNNQLFQLIDICYSTQVNPYLIRKVAKHLNTEPYQLSSIIGSPEYKRYSRTSVFIGLSDGARMDYFRRTSRVDNEQILLTYAVDNDKTQEMSVKLGEIHPGSCFDSIFLIDDFTASGRSFIRKEDKVYKGKLVKTIDSLLKSGKSLNALVKEEAFEIHIIFYIATVASMDYIDEELKLWKSAAGHTFVHTVTAIQELPKSFSATPQSNAELDTLCKKYFDNRLNNKHLEVGDSEKIHLGFNGGGLPLVLSHNTPNNSLPILWSPDDMNFRGLFPRVSRHN